MKKIIKQLWSWICTLLGKTDKTGKTDVENKAIMYGEKPFVFFVDFKKFKNASTPRVPSIHFNYNTEIAAL